MPQFLTTGRYNYLSVKESKNTEAFNSNFWYNNLMGSQDSINVLVALNRVKGESVWETQFVQSFLDIKWEMVFYPILAQAAIYYLYLVLVTIYVTGYPDSTAFRVVLLLFTLFNLSQELLQFSKDNIFDLWNMMDYIFVTLFSVHLMLAFADALDTDSTAYKVLLSIPITLMYFRAIGYLRVFSNTRYLVRLIVEVIWDMKSFLVLLVVLFIQYSVV